MVGVGVDGSVVESDGFVFCGECGGIIGRLRC